MRSFAEYLSFISDQCESRAADALLLSDSDLADRESFSLPKPDRLLHLIEDFFTDFKGRKTHVVPLTAFLENIMQLSTETQSASNCAKLSLMQYDRCSRCDMKGRVDAAHPYSLEAHPTGFKRQDAPRIVDFGPVTWAA